MSGNEKMLDRLLGTRTDFTKIIKVFTNPIGREYIDPITDASVPPVGTGHVNRPWAIAGKAEVLEDLGRGIFLVGVPYTTPTAQAPGLGGAWQMESTGGLESRRVDVELLQPGAGGIPRIVGPYDYKRLDSFPEGPAAPGTLKHFTAGKGGTLLALEGPKDKWIRIPVGIDRFEATGSVFLTKIFANVDPGRLTQAKSRLKWINNDRMTLPGWPPGAFEPRELMLADYRVGKTDVAESATQPQVDIVSLTFTVRDGGWQEEFTHTWADPDLAGSSAAVVLDESDNPVIESFDRQPEARFSGWVESF